jgi:hypothetical protein
MKGLLTNQGTIAIESVLCEACFRLRENRDYAREMASQAGDVDVDKTFTDAWEITQDVVCQICGADNN